MKHKLDKSNVQDIIELNDTQKGILIEWVKGSQDLYTVQLSFQIEGSFDVEVLKKALSVVQEKNDSLRSVFRWEGLSTPLQIILKEAEIEVCTIDLSTLDEIETERKLSEIILNDRQKGFDLLETPFRINLIKMNDDIYTFTITHHHVLYDGWSTGILLKELFESYNNLTEKEETKFIAKPDLKTVYKKSKEKNTLGDKQVFWNTYLADHTTSNLFPKKKKIGVSTNRDKFVLESSIEDLEDFSSKNQVTKAAIIYTSYSLLLQKYTGQSDVTFGRSISNRPPTIVGVEHVIGNLINILPIRIKDENSESLLELVVNTHKSLVENADQFDSSSYFQIKQILDYKSYENLFDSVIAIENYPLDESLLKANDQFNISLNSTYENNSIPLTVTVFFKDTLEIEFDYNKHSVDDTYVKTFADNFLKILNTIIKSPKKNVHDIALLSNKDKKELITQFNTTSLDLPSKATVITVFKEQVSKNPEAIAIRFEEKWMTYAELDVMSNQIASYLSTSKEIIQGNLVGVMLDREFFFIPVILGILKSGAAYVPIDPNYPSERINTIIKDSKLNTLVTRDSHLHEGLVVPVDSVNLDSMLTNLIQEEREYEPNTSQEDIAYVIYTSGSTGTPKGVTIAHKSLLNYLSWGADFYIEEGKGAFPLHTSISFDLTLTSIFIPLVTGNEIVIYKKTDDSLLIEEVLLDDKIDVIKLTPTHLRIINISESLDGKLGNGRLKKMIVGGEMLDHQLAKDIYDKYDGKIDIYNEYGPTEATIGCMIHKFSPDDVSISVPIGKPIANTGIYLLDSHLQPVAMGAIGELYISGSGLSLGYLGREDLTKERFIPNPFIEGEQMYQTGDLARWISDSNVEFLGRIDDQVKIRGYRIELGEIQSHILLVDTIKEAVVIDIENEEGEKSLVAYYVCKSKIEETQFRSFLGDRLPEYMIPTYFVQLNSVPLTQNGKLDKKALPKPELQKNKNLVLPSNDTERKILEMWSQILAVEQDCISTDANFFELGGHSLKAIMFANKAYKEFKVKITVKEVFDNPTILAIGELISNVEKTKFSSIPKVSAKDYYKCSSAQSRLYFLYTLDTSSLAYNMPYTIKISGDVDIDRFAKVFTALIDRHETLRTRFDVIDGKVVQMVSDSSEFEFQYLKEDKDITQVCRKFIKPFDLNKGPLVRAGLIEVTHKEFVLIVDMHHIVNDGLSHAIFIKEFIALYKEEHLAALKLQYRDYAEWQQDSAYQDIVAKDKAFWINEFKEDLETLNLPIDFSRPTIKTYEGDHVKFQINEEQTRKLKLITEQEGATLFMMLMSVFNVLLSNLSNQKDLVVGTPSAGRPHADLENLIGIFLNMLPVRTKLSGKMTFTNFLNSVKSNILACFEHQTFQYEQLIEELNIERDPSHNPLFDVAFFYENFETGELKIPGLELIPYDFDPKTAKFDIVLSASELNNQISLRFDYSTRLFKKKTIKRFAAYFNRIVSEIVENKEIKIGDIEMLSPEESNLLLNQFNNTKLEVPNKNVVQLFEQQVAINPDKTAVVFELKALSYKEIDDLSNKFANYLTQKYNVKPGDIVGLMIDRSEMVIITILGILKLGAAYLPIDPSYPKERKEYVLKDSGATILVSDEKIKEDFTYNGISVLLCDTNDWRSYSNNKLLKSNTVNNLCYMIYTSGSTGMPKGVMISNDNLVNFFVGMDNRLPLSGQDRLLAMTSMSFDISILEFLWTLCSGIEIVIHPSDSSHNELDRYVPVENPVMDFGLFFFASYNHNVEKGKYDLLFESTKFADKNGFSSVWTPERHFHEFGGLFPNPSVISSALSMITEHIELRTGSIVAPLHDSVNILDEWSVVDNLSKGRIALSFAPGWNHDDFALSKFDYKDRHQVTHDKINEIRNLWRNKKISTSNKKQELSIWLTTAGNEDSFRSAGAMGANLLTHLLGQEINELSRKIDIYREARKEAGFDEGKVAIMLHTFIGNTMEEVEAIVEEPFKEYLRSSIGISRMVYKEAGYIEGELSTELQDQVLKNAVKRYYNTSSLIGTKSMAINMVQKLKKAGVDEIGCLIDFGVEESKIKEGLHHLKEVKELFSKKNTLANESVTVFQATPSYFKVLEENTESEKFLASLKTILIGGEAVPASLLKSLRKKTDAAIYNMYGPTETTIWSSVKHLSKEAKEVSVGTPIANTQMYVLDEDLKLLPQGVIGDLFIGGKGVAQGYWNREKLTQERFVENPFISGQKIYKTGDLAKWLPNGEIKLLGREDDQVKIRGFRIELGEIESLLKQNEQVKEAVVIAKKSEGTKQLVAYCVPHKNEDLKGLREFLSEKLPGFMVPNYFVSLKKFPLTPNGKLDKKNLPDPQVGTTENYVAPATEQEKMLVQVWTEVLGEENIGVMDNFFSVGGDSIKSIQISSRMRSEGYIVTVKDIFTSQTIHKLSQKLKKIETTSDQSIVLGEQTLSPIQQWFFEQSSVDSHHFNQAVILNFEEGIEKTLVANIFKKIQEHHDGLRMVFGEKDEKLISTTKNIDLPLSLDEFDLRGEKSQDSKLTSIAERIQSGIDLKNGPLMKLGLFHLDTGSKLLIVIHHLVVDGVSWRILFEDIDSLYQQSRKGTEFSLPLKTDSFQSWPNQILKYAESQDFEKSINYWKSIVTKNYDIIKRDKPGETNKIEDQKTAKFILTKEQTSKLLTDIHLPFGTKINDILLAALLLGVNKQYSVSTVRVDLEGHGREEILSGINFSRTIGWFTSIYPLFMESIDANIAENIVKTKETFRSIPKNGFDYLVLNNFIDTIEDSEKDQNRAQIFFNYLGQFDNNIKDTSFSIGIDDIGNVISKNETSNYDWEILGMVVDGCLEIRITYSTKQYHEETIHELTRVYHHYLEEIIEFCSNYKGVRLTPSDLTYKDLAIADLNELQSDYDLKDIYTLSPMQKGILFHALHDSGSDHYFNQITHKVSSNLDIAMIEKSIDHLISRYDILRTVFVHDKFDQPLQVVLKEKASDFNFVDVRKECLDTSVEEIISQYQKKDRAKKFNLSKDTLLRITVLQTKDEELHIIWNYHHILMDGWCIGIILKDFREIYKSNLRKVEASLSPVNSFGTYIDWVENRNIKETENYWSHYLENYDSPASFLKKKPLDPVCRLNSEQFTLTNDQMDQLKAVSRSIGVSINTIFQCAWGILLAKFNNTNDVVFGSIVSGRPSEIEGIEQMVGLFMNMVPTRITYDSKDTLETLLESAQKMALYSEPHHYHSLGDIQSQNDLGSSLFDHFIVFENYAFEEELVKKNGRDNEQGNFDIQDIKVFEQSNYDLSVAIMPGDNLEVRFDYNSNVFDTSLILSLKQYLNHILTIIPENLNKKVFDIDLLLNTERELIVNTFNNTSSYIDKDASVISLFEKQVQSVPNSIAVWSNEESLTYKELDELSNKIAGYLIENKGVRSGDLVGIMLGRENWFLATIIGVLKTGSAYVPIDYNYPSDRIDLIIDDANLSLLISREQFLNQNIRSKTKIIDLDQKSHQILGSSVMPINKSGSNSLAYVIYTSGSTGTPKGVMMQHKGIVNLVLGLQKNVYSKFPEDNLHVCLLASFAFDSSLQQIFGSLLQGYSLYIADNEDRSDGMRLKSFYARHKIQVSDGTPTHFRFFVKDVDAGTELTDLKIWLLAGEVLSKSLVVEFYDKFIADDVKLFNMYGPTETCVDSTFFEIDYDRLEEYPFIPIGNPLSNERIYIMDDQGRVMPIGAIGELCIAGEGLAQSYLGDDRMTNDKFRTDWIDGERIYRTGDLARWLYDGNIEYIGRKDSQIKLRGYRIELSEIESTIVKHESINDAVVVLKEKDGEKYLVAYYTTKSVIEESTLSKYLQKKLPNYMVPSYYASIDKLPLTPNGKLDHKSLPDFSQSLCLQDAKPSNDVEKKIAEIWSEVLGINKELISVNKSFFELGGHSLKAVSLIGKLSRSFNVQVLLDDVFDKETIKELSDHIITITTLETELADTDNAITITI